MEKETLQKDSNKKPNKVETRVSAPDFVNATFKIPELVLQDLESNGMEARWVAEKNIHASGMHKSGWTPYQLSDKVYNKISPFGRDPNRFIRHGDLILAVKTKEQALHHRKWLQQNAEDNRVDKRKKKLYQEMRDFVKEAKLDSIVNVKEGYEDNA